MDWQKRAAGLLRQEIEAVISAVPAAGSLGGLLREPLEKARRGLHPASGHDRPWPLLPLIVSEAICGRYKQVLPAAAAFQFLLAAADVFDDIEDADSPDSLYARYGPAAATSAASTLLILGEYCLTRLKSRDVDPDIIVRVVEVVNSFYIKACAGQHLDLTVDKKYITEEIYLEVAAMKTASQVECACCIGALLAGATENILGIFTAFGHNLGMASQLTNDIQGIIRGTDVIKSKMTLPVIYALAEAGGEFRHQLEAVYISPTGPVADPEPVKSILFNTGAIHYATVKMEYYKQLARDALSEAELLGAKVDSLRIFFNKPMEYQ